MSGLLQLYRDVASRGTCSRTIVQLLCDLDIPAEPHLLAAISTLSNTLQDNGFEIIPAMTRGDLDTPRSIRFAVANAYSSDQLLRDISNGETNGREFKSSLQFDVTRWQRDPGKAVDTYRSPKVLHSTLKTIAAFMNSDGGALYIGVDDAGHVLGLANDYRLSATPSRDKLELFLRNELATRFHDGALISSFVRISFVHANGCDDVAIIDVTARPTRLSCLVRPDGDRDDYMVYRRDGNRTVAVPIEHLEEFIMERKKRLEPS
jgi:hypothetical protein